MTTARRSLDACGCLWTGIKGGALQLSDRQMPNDINRCSQQLRNNWIFVLIREISLHGCRCGGQVHRGREGLARGQVMKGWKCEEGKREERQDSSERR